MGLFHTRVNVKALVSGSITTMLHSNIRHAEVVGMLSGCTGGRATASEEKRCFATLHKAGVNTLGTTGNWLSEKLFEKVVTFYVSRIKNK
jgi:hypothetical protein